MDGIIINLPGGVILHFPEGTPQEEIQRTIREATGEAAGQFGAGLPQSEFRNGQLSEPQTPPLLQGAVERFERGEQQPPLTFQAEPGFEQPPLGEGLGQLADVGGQAVEQAGGYLGRGLRGATVGGFEQGNAALAGLGNVFGEGGFSQGYDRSLAAQRALMGAVPEPLGDIAETAGAMGTAFVAGPAALSNMSVPAMMSVGLPLGAAGGFAYPLATGQGGVEEALMGAAVGGGVGLAAPPLFHAGGAIAAKIGGRAPQRLVTDLPPSPVAWAREADWDDLAGPAVVRNAPRVDQYDSSFSQDYITANQEYYRAVGHRLYQLAEESGGTLPIGGVLESLGPLEQQFRLQFDPELANSLTGRLRQARSVLGEHGDSVPVTALEEWRQQLTRDIWSAPSGSNLRTQLENIRNTVDDQIDLATERYPVAREMWRTVKQLDVLENLAHRASGTSARSGGTYEDAFYRELVRVHNARSPREWGVFSQEQQQAIMDAVAAGGPRGLHTINQIFSKVFPSNIAQSISGAVGVISGNPLLAAPIVASTADRVMTGAARNRAIEALMGETLPQGGQSAMPRPGFSMRPWPYATIPAQAGNATTGGGF